VLRQTERGPGTFFRAPSLVRELPKPGAPTGSDITGPPGSNDPGTQMLRPLPVSPAEHWVVAAEQQIRQQRLITPPGANAYDSLIAAWKADPTHPRLAADVAQLVGALGTKAGRNLRDGNDRRATEYLQRAHQLAGQTHLADSPAMTTLHTTIANALDARLTQAQTRFNRADALAVVETARGLGVDPQTIAAFDARARNIPAPGQTLDDDTRLVRVGDKVISAATSDVSRADYARFVLATGRPAALCRERASLLRLLAPRSWKAPGFEQSPAQPVVCVSWNDAAAYAQWLSAHKGHRYRLPTAAEARALPGASGAKPVANWVDECVQGCSQRLSTGRSWRGTAGARPLDPARGYDDVGFRLVRDQ